MRLAIDRLSVKRDERLVLDEVSCAVASGTAVVLTGPNGAGKTTLIRTIAGFLTPSSGSVILDGGDPELDLAQQCHLVGHSNGVKPAMTVEENLTFWAEFLGGDKGRVASAMDALALDSISSIEAAYLSAGQKRRVGLARLLVAERPLWLLDEPTVSLDAASTAKFAGLINAHTAKGGIAIIATHLPIGLERTQDLKLNPHRAREAA